MAIEKEDEMNANVRIFLLASSLLFGGHAEAERTIKDCDAMHGGSTMQQACYNAVRAKIIGKEIERLLKIVKSKFDSYPQPAYSSLLLDLSQDEWLSYKEKQCELEQHLYGGIVSVNHLRCEERINLERKKLLQEMAH
jgi:uncharacterized protein YecT (DUF1311 family)